MSTGSLLYLEYVNSHLALVKLRVASMYTHTHVIFEETNVEFPKIAQKQKSHEARVELGWCVKFSQD